MPGIPTTPCLRAAAQRAGCQITLPRRPIQVGQRGAGTFARRSCAWRLRRVVALRNWAADVNQLNLTSSLPRNSPRRISVCIAYTGAELQDLRPGGRRVELRVMTRRFRCDAVLCERQIFAERFADGAVDRTPRPYRSSSWADLGRPSRRRLRRASDGACEQRHAAANRSSAPSGDWQCEGAIRQVGFSPPSCLCRRRSLVERFFNRDQAARTITETRRPPAMDGSGGPYATVAGLEQRSRRGGGWNWVGVVSGLLNPNDSGVGALERRPRHDEGYHEGGGCRRRGFAFR